MGIKKLQLEGFNPIDNGERDSSDSEEIAGIFSTDNEVGSINEKLTGGRKIIEISVDDIIPSKHNKFDRYSDQKKEAMIDSIKENGIIEPITLRVLTDGKYEIISGENRWICAKEAGLTTVPAHPITCDEDQAIIMLNETNLINRDVSFRERIISYSEQYHAMKRRAGERNDLQNDGKKIDTLEILAKKYGESKTQMYRYIRTSELSNELITLVGMKKIALNAAVKLTELQKESQEMLYNYIIENSVKKVNEGHANEMLKCSGILNETMLDDIFETEEKKDKPIKNIKFEKFSRFFGSDTKAEEIETTIEMALQMYFERQCQEMEENEYASYGEIE